MWKGLREVVVGPCVDSGHFLVPVVAGSQDKNRHGPPACAPLPQDCDAVHLRQTQIEDDGIVLARLAGMQRIHAVVHDIDGVVGLRQRLSQLSGECFFILDHQ
jgi:hypothetical protein